MSETTCAFPECSAPRHGATLCAAHLAQRRKGKPLKPLRPVVPCHVEGCEKTTYSGTCKLHAERIQRLGTPFLSTLAERFWAKVEKTETCWLWMGYRNQHGYGQVGIEGRRLDGAHRVSLRLTGVTIPDGYDVDHLCRVPACVRPDHLEPVPHSVNMDRAPYTAIQFQRAKTHCPAGHEYTPENTYARPNSSGTLSRECRTCRRARRKEFRR